MLGLARALTAAAVCCYLTTHAYAEDDVWEDSIPTLEEVQKNLYVPNVPPSSEATPIQTAPNSNALEWQKSFDSAVEESREKLKEMGLVPEDIFLDCKGGDKARCEEQYAAGINGATDEELDSIQYATTITPIGRQIESSGKKCSEGSNVIEFMGELTLALARMHNSDSFIRRNFTSEYKIAKDQFFELANLVRADLYKRGLLDIFWVHPDKTYQENFDAIVINYERVDQEFDSYCRRRYFFSAFESYCRNYCDMYKLFSLFGEYPEKKYQWSEHGEYAEPGYATVNYHMCDTATHPYNWNFKLKRSNKKDCISSLKPSYKPSEKVLKSLGL